VLAAQARQLEAQVDHRAEIARLALNLDAFCQRVRTGLAQATWEQKRQLIGWLVARFVTERLVGQPKGYRRIAPRYDKLAVTYLAFVQLAAIRMWL
jgi:site-specific DNA recombinase